MTDPVELLKECLLSLRQPSASYGSEWRDRAVATQNAIIAERIEKAIQLIEAERSARVLIDPCLPGARAEALAAEVLKRGGNFA